MVVRKRENKVPTPARSALSVYVVGAYAYADSCLSKDTAEDVFATSN